MSKETGYYKCTNSLVKLVLHLLLWISECLESHPPLSYDLILSRLSVRHYDVTAILKCFTFFAIVLGVETITSKWTYLPSVHWM